MQAKSSTSSELPGIPVRGGVVVVSGYGVRVAVERGQLAMGDGIADERRESRFSKASCGIKRLVLLGHSGAVSLEALRWLHDLGAAVVQVDADGQVILASAPLGSNNAHLRRAQALAYGTPEGLAIVRDLLRQKIGGQGSVLGAMGKSDDAEALTAYSGALDGAESVEQLRLVESQAAALYWAAWAEVPLAFARRDSGRVPPHWQTFGQRSSPLTRSPRKAATPANALLNYLYAVLEAETRIALLTVGLDPGLGLLHADLDARDSLALDVMEAARPAADAWLLRFLGTYTFAAQDFFETREGVVRVTSRLTPHLAETAPLGATAIAPVAEHVARQLYRWWKGAGSGRGGKRDARLPTPLTETNRSAGRPRIGRGERPAELGISPHSRSCPQCGGAVISGRKKFCRQECRTVYGREVSRPTFERAGPSKLAELRASGRDPARRPAALAKLAATQRERAAARAHWEKEHAGEVYDPEAFRRQILAPLQGVPLSVMMAATGLSVRHCAEIRRGLRTPHPRHWQAFAALGGVLAHVGPAAPQPARPPVEVADVRDGSGGAG